ncbi:MAG: CPBP family intramembrane glutamic endopeptidase [Planctomycetota bacterium]
MFGSVWSIVAAFALCSSVGAALAFAGPADVVPEAVENTGAWLASLQVPFVLAAGAVCVAVVAFGTRTLRPGGLDIGGERDVSGQTALIWAFAAGMVFILQGFAVTLARAWLGVGRIEDALGGVKASGAIAAVSGALGLMTAIGMAALLHRSSPKAGLRIRGRDTAVGAGLFLLLFPIVAGFGLVAAAAASWMGVASGEALAHETLREIRGNAGNIWTWGLVFQAVVAAPIIEELLYRGMLQSAARRATGSAWAAVLLTSFFFAFMHWSIVPDGSRHQIVQLFVLSVAMGAVFERTKSIGVAIVIHMLFNALNIVMAIA